MQAYDDTNVFAKILRAEISAKILYETPHSLAFYDAFPKAPTHVLVIPKGSYVDLGHFCQNAPNEEIIDFWRAVSHVTSLLGLHKDGFRMIANSGANGGQEVPHFHIHLCGGKKLGAMLPG